MEPHTLLMEERQLVTSKTCSKKKPSNGPNVLSSFRFSFFTITIGQPSIYKRPCLGYVLVGNDPRTHLYVNMKKKACEAVGFEHIGSVLPEDASEEDVLRRIKDLNDDERVSGILVQLPLPSYFSLQKVFEAIRPDKDVDGVHPANVVDLVIRDKDPLYMPCTAKGCLYIIQRYCPSVIGKRAVVVGQSMIVGAPIAYSLQNMDATVTSCNIMTKNLPKITKEADILVVSIGNPLFIKGDWVKPGALVVDVGTNVIPDSRAGSGTRVVGDVDFEEAVKVAAYITPVPGGVGPMTIAMLLENVFLAWKRANFPIKIPYEQSQGWFGNNLVNIKTMLIVRR
eukprot:TRINITY_DN382_c0_g2_i1.p4 TRINITY_DN382_c0_g2~~TRINITY_DN382_c0_g2_i1.p4  ORF type:complete len:339 (+),score=20.13 TRINITY_DN382_c0_g2_i1:3437-4453(+)